MDLKHGPYDTKDGDKPSLLGSPMGCWCCAWCCAQPPPSVVQRSTMTAQAATSLLPLPAPTPGQMFPWLQLQAGKRSRAHTCTQTNAAVQLVPPGHNAGGNSALHG